MAGCLCGERIDYPGPGEPGSTEDATIAVAAGPSVGEGIVATVGEAVVEAQRHTPPDDVGFRQILQRRVDSERLSLHSSRRGQRCEALERRHVFRTTVRVSRVIKCVHADDEIVRAKERLGDTPFAVELRHASWFNDKNRERTIAFLHKHEIPFVMVDAPPGTKSSVPPLTLISSPKLAVVRFHGRRSETWEKSGIPVVERFRYLYDEGELSEWVPRIREAAEHAPEVHVLMNNCYANYGTTNAREIADLLAASIPRLDT